MKLRCDVVDKLNKSLPLLHFLLCIFLWPHAINAQVLPGRLFEENCPSFPEYTEMHWAAMQGRPVMDKPRFLVTHDNDGLADRYVNAASAFIVALITQRVLCILPSPPVHKGLWFWTHQPALETAFDAPFIDWTCPGFSPLDDPSLSQSLIDTATDQDKWKNLVQIDGKGTPMYQLFIESNLTALKENEADVFTLLVHRGISFGIFKNKYHSQQLVDLGLNPETAFGCITSYLLRPNRVSFNLVNKELMSLMTNDKIFKIGIQIRSGDHLIKHNTFKISDEAFDRLARPYFDCAKTLETSIRESNPYQRDKPIYYYLMTDSLAIREKALKRYPDKIRYYNETEIEFYKTVTETGLRRTVMEHWLLQQAHFHIITRTSGLGRTAAYASLRKGTVFTLGFGSEFEYSLGRLKNEGDTSKREGGRGCKIEDNDPIETTYTVWSGI